MFEIKLTPDDVNKFVTDALMKSVLGERLSEAINKAMNDSLFGYNNPIKKLCDEAIARHLDEYLRLPENADKLKELAAKHLAHAGFDEVLGAAITKTIKSLSY